MDWLYRATLEELLMHQRKIRNRLIAFPRLVPSRQQDWLKNIDEELRIRRIYAE